MSDKIAIGFHSFGTVTTGFAVALSGMIRYEGLRVSNMIHVPSPYVAEARNKIVHQFLYKTTATHLLMVDCDLEFPDDSLSRTYSAMKHVGAEVMFGCYALGDYRPSVFGFPPENTSNLPTVALDLKHGEVYNIFAGSTGWLLATREALTKIEEANTNRHWKWFDHDIEYAGETFSLGELGKIDNHTIRIGEDFSFSKRAREAGVKLWGTTSPLLLHCKYQPLLNSFQREAALAAGYGAFYGGPNANIVQETSAEKEVDIKLTEAEIADAVATDEGEVV
jgi:hypothetical protein